MLLGSFTYVRLRTDYFKNFEDKINDDTYVELWVYI